MKVRNLRIGVLITLLLVLAVAFTGCSKSVKDEALEKVKAVDLKAYMQEDRDAVKEFKSAYEKDLKKAKDDKAAEKIMKQFKKDLKTFATKKEKIETYTKLVKEQIKALPEDKQKEANKVLDSYKDKLNKLDSNKDFDALTTEINGKITEISGTTVEVTASQVETSTPAAKQVIKQQTAASSSSNSKTAKSSSSSSASTSASKAKQRVWVVDKAAWTETKYRTETYQYTVYRTSDGKEFATYAQAYAYYEKMGDEGYPINFGAVTKTGTRQVPYTVSHPEQGHWEYR
jgi:lipoprotein